MKKKPSYAIIIISCLSLLITKNVWADKGALLLNYQTDSAAKWYTASFEVLNPSAKKFNIEKFGNVFLDGKNSIVKIAPEINGLSGIKLPTFSNSQHISLSIRFEESSKLLLGVVRDSNNKNKSLLSSFIKINPAKLNPILVLENAITITGLSAVDVYAISYSKGMHTININNSKKEFVLLGVVKESQPTSYHDAKMPDGLPWDPFLVEGFNNEAPLFEIISGPSNPVIAEGMPGTTNIQGGFEGGACVKVGNTYHLFPTERAGEQGIDAYFDRVKTRIGHWVSTDAIHWTRKATLYQASGNYAITNGDNPMNDRRGAIWSYMPVFSEKENRWYGYYLAYTVDKDLAPNHSFGRIWRTESVKEGRDGIDGPYKDKGIIMEPGWDSQLWEGRQGVDSFYPYQVGNEWLAFYGGAYPYKSRKDYPDKMGKGWFVGLAKSASLEGPWKRLDTTINPIKSIHPWFIENPIVYTLPNGLYITIFDGGPEGWGHHLPNMFGYALSKDGYHWSEAHYLPIETKVNKWWDIMRTPLCLIPEGNNIYTIIYAAINISKRFHPIGMVRVKLNKDILDAKLKELQ